jgi:hypothetical protein
MPQGVLIFFSILCSQSEPTIWGRVSYLPNNLNLDYISHWVVCVNLNNVVYPLSLSGVALCFVSVISAILILPCCGLLILTLHQCALQCITCASGGGGVN